MQASAAERVLASANRYVTEWGGVVTKRGCLSDLLSGAQNAVEYETWEKVRDTDLAALYVPVLDGSPDGSWLTMPYATPLTVPSQSLLWDIERELTSYGTSVYDLHADNVGYLDGRLVVLDYGYTREMNRTVQKKGRTFCGSCDYCQLTYRESVRDEDELRYL